MDLDPSSERQSEVVEFLLDLLDTRHVTIELLHENFTTSEVRTSDYTGHAKLPSSLARFVDTSVPTKFSVASRVERERTDSEAFVNLTELVISPEDRLPITIRDEKGIVSVQQGEELLVDSEGKVLREVLESMFSNNTSSEKLKRLSNLQLLDIVLALSVNVARYYEYKIEDPLQQVTIASTELETESDSSESLSIELLRPHACTANVGTRISISESLSDRSADRSTDAKSVYHTADVRAIYNDLDSILTVEDLFNVGETNQQVPIRSITHYHMSDTLDALATLIKLK